ncbi:MAG TPA: lysylphosphatidylglycerol synthase transmembrane domain-containing protein [Candidatus Limnocylindria bacterium]|nr:lysylphosphatidylglycerol synthase transmembrane domain-containing protein [Candidatus Limnocylindria bacterium]
MRAPIRRLLFSVFGLILVVFLIFHFRHMVSRHSFSAGKLLGALREANIWYLLLSLAAIYACYAIRALRWIRFSRYLGPASFWSVYGLTLAGFASIFLLGRLGEPVRPLLIARKEKHPVAGTFGVYTVERLFDITTTTVMAGIALLAGATPASTVTIARSAGAGLLFVLVLAIGFLIYLRVHGAEFLQKRLAKWQGEIRWRQRVAGVVNGLVSGLHSIRTVSDLLAAVFYSALHWFLIALVYFWVVRAFGEDFDSITLPGATLVLAFTMVGSVLQLPTVGGGSQLASFFAFTTWFRVEQEPAIAAANVLWLITFASCSLAGVPVLIREGWSLGKLLHLAETDIPADAEMPGEAAPSNRSAKQPGAGPGVSPE